MPLDETWSLPSCWPQAENVSPKNRRTALYLKLHIDSWMLFSSLDPLHRTFMLDLFVGLDIGLAGCLAGWLAGCHDAQSPHHFTGSAVDRLHHPPSLKL